MDKITMTGFTSSFKVVKVNKGEASDTSIEIASEVPYTIVANGKEISTLMCSPSDLKELTYGFLYNSGFINSSSDIATFDLKEHDHKIFVTFSKDFDYDNLNRIISQNAEKRINYSDTGKNNFIPANFDFSVSKEIISGAMKWFQYRSIIFKATNGVHSSALSMNGEIPEKIFEDVARHNAVDKVTGSALIQNVDFLKSLLFCSCRISSEILHKAVRCKIPFVISFHSPTHQAILLARKTKVTLIGNLKMSSFIIYTCPQRVIL